MPGTVTVVSKLPHGFRMQLQEKVVVAEPTQQEPTRKVEMSRFGGKVIEIPGAAVPRDPNMDFDTITPRVGGYVVVPGVDKDFADKWRQQMEDWEPLKSGAVRIDENSGRVEGWAREHKGMLIGFEPVNPKALPGEFAGQIEEATEQNRR